MTNQNHFCETVSLIKGLSIAEWFGVEMAFLDGEQTQTGEPVWSTDCIPYKQFLEIGFRTQNSWRIFHTEQNGDEWGLGLFERAPIPTEESSLFRNVSLNEFPTGKIFDCRVATNDCGNISQIAIKIEETNVVIRPGEIYVDENGKFSPQFMDESVLVALSNKVVSSD